MTKEEQIKERLAKPLEVGDDVDIRIEYTKTEHKKVGKKFIDVESSQVKTGHGKIIDFIETKEHGTLYSIESHNFSLPYEIKLKGYENYNDKYCKKEWLTQSIDDCGFNNFKPSPRIDFTNAAIFQLLSKMCYGRRSGNFMTPEYTEIKGTSPGDKPYIGFTYGGTNFDPYVIDENGEKAYFQRGLVWTEDQNRLLIDSIYNGIEIGKFLFRYKSWEHIQAQMKESGHGYDFDCVDGKQRLNAILKFVQNKFKDSYGNYFSDLSAQAQREFLNYGKLAVGTMAEGTEDKDVLNAFLFVNFTGIPMSKDHIEYVKTIKI